MDLYPSIIKALTCLDNQGGHKWHFYKACNWLQNLYLLVEFVKNPTGQMVRPQLPFCIPSKKDSLRFQRITANIIFLLQVTKTDFLCCKLQKFWRLKFTSNFWKGDWNMMKMSWNNYSTQVSLTQVSFLILNFILLKIHSISITQFWYSGRVEDNVLLKSSSDFG